MSLFFLGFTLDVKLTRHAKRRRKEMHITERAVEACIQDPDVSYPAGGWQGSKYLSGRTCYQRGDLAVIVDDETEEVITVLWNLPGGQEWER